ncbi:MAG: hypothetical protein K6U11_07120 [bacterium]|nr:hypothetical protein [bacterium]
MKKILRVCLMFLISALFILIMVDRVIADSTSKAVTTTFKGHIESAEDRDRDGTPDKWKIKLGPDNIVVIEAPLKPEGGRLDYKEPPFSEFVKTCTNVKAKVIIAKEGSKKIIIVDSWESIGSYSCCARVDEGDWIGASPDTTYTEQGE